jgi:hypothetical protein
MKKRQPKSTDNEIHQRFQEPKSQLSKLENDVRLRSDDRR